MSQVNDGRKTCSKCGKEFLATAQYFHRRRASHDGLNPSCKECVSVWMKEYYYQHREQQLAANKRWHEEHREERRAYNRRWREEHREEVRAWTNQYRQKNPVQRVRRSVSQGMRQALQERKNGRHWESLVGYTLDDLIKHLESLFLPGMTWENYGEWHIDHIRPVSSFSFESVEDPEFKKCFALYNLQPLWAKENCRKHTDWDGQVTLSFAGAPVKGDGG